MMDSAPFLQCVPCGEVQFLCAEFAVVSYSELHAVRDVHTSSTCTYTFSLICLQEKYCYGAFVLISEPSGNSSSQSKLPVGGKDLLLKLVPSSRLLQGICQQKNMTVKCHNVNSYLWQPLDLCYSHMQELMVVNQPYGRGIHKKEYPPLGSATAWLVFDSAGTSCFKKIGNKLWYFKQYCSRKVINRKLRADK